MKRKNVFVNCHHFANAFLAKNIDGGPLPNIGENMTVAQVAFYVLAMVWCIIKDSYGSNSIAPVMD